MQVGQGQEWRAVQNHSAGLFALSRSLDVPGQSLASELWHKITSFLFDVLHGIKSFTFHILQVIKSFFLGVLHAIATFLLGALRLLGLILFWLLVVILVFCVLVVWYEVIFMKILPFPLKACW